MACPPLSKAGQARRKIRKFRYGIAETGEKL